MISKNTKLVSFTIDGVLAVDAGSLSSELSFKEQRRIKTILLSHGHYDHIKEVPSFIFNSLNNGLQQPIKIIASSTTNHILKTCLFDGTIYPDYAGNNSYLGKPAVELQPLKHFQSINIEKYHITAIPVKHNIKTIGFLISTKKKSLFYTGDTGAGLTYIWDHISPQLIITEMTFPNRLENVAKDSGHLCPRLLKLELQKLKKTKGYLPRVILIHLNPHLEDEISWEIKSLTKEMGAAIEIATEGDTHRV